MKFQESEFYKKWAVAGMPKDKQKLAEAAWLDGRQDYKDICDQLKAYMIFDDPMRCVKDLVRQMYPPKSGTRGNYDPKFISGMQALAKHAHAISTNFNELSDEECRLVSYAPDGSTCTINLKGEEIYLTRCMEK